MQQSGKLYPIIIVLLILSIGVLIGIIIKSDSSINKPIVKGKLSTSITDASTNTEASPLTASVIKSNDRLHLEMAEKISSESNARKELEQTVLNLKLEVSKLGNELQKIGPTSSSSPHSTSATQSQNSSQWFNEKAMATTSLSKTEISQMKNQYESIEMEKLYLRDKAIRENWIGTQRYSDELGVLNSKFETFRNAVDDTVYETLLYATGQPNRVVVQDVMRNSPAFLAGIKAGDQILQYSNERIYSAFDLRKSITSGDLGEEVKINLSRDGNKMTVYLPRGPLGIRMESASIEP